MKGFGSTIKALLLIVGISLFIAGGLWMLGVRALPALDGELTLNGLGAGVTISRDSHGVPLIVAESEDDAYFALGYVHAQDRLFQMELMRHQGQGRLAEIFGASAVPSDRFMRTLGVYRRAQDDFQNLDPATQNAFQRYAAGVNAWLGEGHALPLEFRLLFLVPEPWQPADSLVWQKLMGLQLSGNWTQELLNAALVAKLGAEKAAVLFPDPAAADPVTVNKRADLFRDLHPERLLAAATAVIQPTSASNAWVLDGAHSETGKPFLANDPHLGFQAPSVWYFAGIDTPKFKIFGATVPGVPLHLLGHNDHVAWGITTPESDTSDLFIERLSNDGKTYDSPDGPMAFDVREETIFVRLGHDVPLEIRETRHGPVVSDILADDAKMAKIPEGHVLALEAALFQPGDHSADGVYQMNHAGDTQGFIEAIRRFHAPQQNMMFADTNGTIGYYAPGRVPIRKAGDGTVPVPGWSGDYDWTVWIPFDELPRDIAPASGVLVNANNKMVDKGYPYMISAHWYDAYRARRINQLITAGNRTTLAKTEGLQQDIVSLMAREMIPLLIARTEPRTDRHRQILAMLRAWDGVMDRRLAEPLLFSLWMEKLKDRILADDLGDLYPEMGGTRAEVLRNILTQYPEWCDDTRTPEKETCEQQVNGAFSEVMIWLDAHDIKDFANLRWGDYHKATFANLLFGNIPYFSAVGRTRLSSSGDNYTINRGSFSSSTARQPFRHFHGASLRAIYDFSDLSHSKFALAGGQSGQLASRNYGDLLESWRDGAYFEAPTADNAAHQLRLKPPRP